MSRYLSLLLLFMGIVLSPLRAAGATVPTFFAYDAAVRPTSTVWIEARPSLRPERGVVREYAYDDAHDGYDGASNPPVVGRAGTDHAYERALNLAARREVDGEGATYDAAAPTAAAEGPEAAARTEFAVADRVAGQLADSRLGPLAAKISPAQLQELANNSDALKFLDTASGHTNTMQLVEGRLLRITTAGDNGMRIISVGPMQRNGLFNGIANGRFTPSVE